MSIDDAALTDLAARQAGTFSRRQVFAAGGDDGLVRSRLRRGRWTAVAPGVYAIAGCPPTDERQLWVAWLAAGPGAVVSHECAAERHGMSAVPKGRLVLTARHGTHHRISGAFVHQLDDMRLHHVANVGGLPVTTVPRTIVDLAAVLAPVRVARCLEDAVNRRLTTDRAVAGVLGDVARPRKPGVRKLAQILDERAPGSAIPQSVLEELLLAAIVAGGNPLPVAQFPHPGRHPAEGRVDFAYPDVRLILEADGRQWHQRVADLARDRARDNEAARAGWLTMRFMHDELRDDPEDVGRAVREVRASRE